MGKLKLPTDGEKQESRTAEVVEDIATDYTVTERFVVEDEPAVSMVRDVLDINGAKARIAKHLLKLDDMIAEASALKVIDDVTQDKAIEQGAQARDLFNRLEKLRKDIVEEPGRKIKAINALFKTPKDKLTRIFRGHEKKVGDYQYQLEIKRREAQKKMEDEQRERQKKLDEAADAAKVDRVSLPAMKAPRKKEPVRTTSGSASSKMVWDWEITDRDKVPREYLQIDKGAINRAVDAGLREIAGIRIFERSKTQIRKF